MKSSVVCGNSLSALYLAKIITVRGGQMVLPSDFRGLGGIILRTENSLYSNTIKQKHIYLGNGVSLSDFNKMFYPRVSAESSGNYTIPTPQICGKAYLLSH